MSNKEKRFEQVREVGETVATVAGYVASRAVFTAAYYLIVTPAGMIAKARGKEYMALKPDAAQQSYWNHRDRQPASRASYEKQR